MKPPPGWGRPAPINGTLSALRRMYGEELLEYSGYVRRWRSPIGTFLDQAVRENTEADVQAAIAAARHLDPSQGAISKGGLPIVRRVLTEPRYLAAAQAVVALHGFKDEAFRFYDALFIDGGEGSADVLMPWVEKTTRSDAEWMWNRYQRLAPTVPLQLLLDRLAQRKPKPKTLPPRWQRTPYEVRLDGEHLEKAARKLPRLVARFDPDDAVIRVWATIGDQPLKLARLPSVKAFPDWLKGLEQQHRMRLNWQRARWNTRLGREGRQLLEAWMRSGVITSSGTSRKRATSPAR